MAITLYYGPVVGVSGWRIPFDRINAHEPQNLARYGDDPRKIYAHCYIDDKQVGGLPTWPEIYEYITNEEKKWKENLNKV